MDFEDTDIWRSAMSVRPDDSHQRHRDRLRSAYMTAWNHGCELAAQISRDLPQLTLHDERHFEALWRRADQIIGNSEPLNPAEVFVFGCAVILHDAANSVVAYPGGLKAIEESAEWRDELAERLCETDQSFTNDSEADDAPEDLKRTVLLHALRRLHARQAEVLAELVFRNAAGAEAKVINDDSLRNHLGRLIGLIAASHHWNIQDIPKKLPKIVGALAEFPPSWTIRPIRLACLLRCADATQLDQARAPDFLYAMLDLRGVSAQHWRAQNKLLSPVIDPDDDSALIFSSGQEFRADDVEAWWIACDAIKIANRELQDSSALLKDLKQGTFQIDRVRDAESPDRLAKHVKVSGWRPVLAEVKVSDVSNVVKLFGGQQLYGSNLLVPLREMIQNAADAIRRRREMPGEKSFQGEITVRLTRSGNTLHLMVSDDGIGMSESALTGPLIEFGSSYYGSSLAKEERPGMVARVGSRLGKYGIGFFSVFIIGRAVEVTSRPFDQSVNDAKTLSFRDGFSLHPVLLDADPSCVGSLVCTTVDLTITDETLEDMCNLRVDYYTDSKVRLDFEDVVKMTTGTIDIDVYVELDGAERVLVHSRSWYKADWRDWVKEKVLYRYRDEETKGHIDLLVPLIEPISPDNPALGLAAISPFYNHLGLETVGGLPATNDDRMPVFEDSICGCIEFTSRGPRRDSGRVRDRQAVSDWATRQAAKLALLTLSSDYKLEAANRITTFGGDPWDVLEIEVSRKKMGLPQLLDLLLDGVEVWAIIRLQTYKSSNHIVDIARVRLKRDTTAIRIADDELAFDQAILELPSDTLGGAYELFCYSSDDEIPDSMLFGLIRRRLSSLGYELRISAPLRGRVATYVGAASERDNVVHGMDLEADYITLAAVAVA